MKKCPPGVICIENFTSLISLLLSHNFFYKMANYL